MKKLIAALSCAVLACADVESEPNDAPPNPASPSTTASGSASGSAKKTDLYFSTFGSPKDPAVVFLHGGPGATAFGFELTAAPLIAAKGYFVIAYDQRGSARSPKGAIGDYSYARSIADLDDLLATVGVSSPVLLAHSFGGSIALSYLDARPGKTRGVILVASPMDFPATYDTTLEKAAERYFYTARLDQAHEARLLRQQMFPHGPLPPFAYGITEIGKVVATMEDAKIDYTLVPTLDDVSFYAEALLDPRHDEGMAINPDVGAGFQANDRVGHTSFLPLLTKHKAEVRAIYAAHEDLMFSRTQMEAIRTNVARLDLVEGASHFVYVDQTQKFVDLAVEDLAAMTR